MMEAYLSLSITMKVYGWSKYGGANNGAAKMMSEKEWFCQACQEEQMKDLPHYLFPMDVFNRDYAKICARCKGEANRKQIRYYPELRSYMRAIIKHYSWFD